MKSIAISRNYELLVALRMSGFEGIFCKDVHSLKMEFKDALKQNQIGIILLSEDDFQEMREEVFEVKKKKRGPLIVTLPGRGGFKEQDFILKYVKEAVGLKLDR